MEIYQIVFIIVGFLFLVALILFLIKRKKKSKQWLLFEKTEGLEGSPKKSYFAINKKNPMIKKPAYPITKPDNIHLIDGGYINKLIK